MGAAAYYLTECDMDNESGLNEEQEFNNHSQRKETKMSEKNTRLLTPIGQAKWCHVHTPKAAFQEKDGKSKGEPKYMVDVCFSADDTEWKKWASDLSAQIKALPNVIDKHTGESLKKQMPIKRELDIDDKPTGRFYVTFKTGEKFKPPVFDKFGVAIPDTIMIGNDSKVRVSYTPVPYDAFGGGIALYLNALQVVDLVEYRAHTADAYGFEVATPTSAEDFSATMPQGSDDFKDDVPF